MQRSGGDVEMQTGHGLTHGVELDAYMTEFSGSDASVGAITYLLACMHYVHNYILLQPRMRIPIFMDSISIKI